jgi:predicted ABC-type ATPase
MNRLRLIAGPNGSGKSSVFKEIKQFKEKQKVIHTGPFVNSDVIENDFKEKGQLDLKQFDITSPPKSLIQDYLKISTFKGSKYDPAILPDLITLDESLLRLKSAVSSPFIGMLVSDLVRNYLLETKVSFTMETVFSDSDKIAFMRKAIANEYKVYFYFVSTEDPQINVKRVEGRVAAGGHPVLEKKIIERYERTMNNLYEAVKLSY